MSQLRRRPPLEFTVLEHRWNPATFTVLNDFTSGAGSLEQAMMDANGNGTDDTIVFDPAFFNSTTPRTINLAATQSSNFEMLEIIGTRQNLLTISGDLTFQLFDTENTHFIVRDLTLVGGNNSNGNGGAIEGTNVELYNVTLHTNFASGNGGAVSAQSLRVEHCTINNNFAEVDGGGTFSNSLFVAATTYDRNSAGRSGGGAHNFAFDDDGVTISHSTFSNNSAENGGGLTAQVPLRNTPPFAGFILQSTFSGNGASRKGGGIFLDGFNNDTSMTVHQSTIALNSAGEFGGGIAMFHYNTSPSGPTLEFIASAFIGNMDSSTTFDTSDISVTSDPMPSFFSLNSEYCAYGGNPAPFLNSFMDVFNVPNDALGPLQFNGGPTFTHEPTEYSILHDAVPASYAFTDWDQRLEPFQRVVNDLLDIGSVELQKQPAIAVTSFTVNEGAVQRSRLTTISITFANTVDVAALNALGGITLTRTHATSQGTVGTVVQTGATGNNGRITLIPDSGYTNVVTLIFDNADGSGVSAGVEHGSLADGRWRLAVPTSAFQSSFGDPTLRRLFGDIDNNGTVDGSTDFAAFGNAFGSTIGSPNYVAAFDWDNNGTIDGGSDFAQFGNRFGITL